MTRDMQWIVAAALAGVTLALAFPAGAARVRVPAQKKKGYQAVSLLGRRVEQVAQMPGFAAFALAAATGESNGNTLAVNDDTSEADAACRIYERNADTLFAQNPYPPERFCFGSGGLYAFLPAVALASSSDFHNLDPYLVFDPRASTAFLATWSRRVVKNYFYKLPKSCRTWLTLRRFMASIKIGKDCDETNYDRSEQVRIKFAKHLKMRGIDPSFMHQRVTIGAWPGASEIYQQLSAVEGLPDLPEGAWAPDTPAPEAS